MRPSVFATVPRDADMSDVVVAAVGLTKCFGRTIAVNRLNLAVERGSVHGLLGPNGSGKSTTVKMLLGLVKPESGEIRLLGEPLAEHSSELLRHVGALVETPAF